MVVQEVVQYAENIESEADLYAELGFFPLELLSRDLKKAAEDLTASQARYFVDFYYTWQEARKSSANIVRSSAAEYAGEDEPNQLVAWLTDNAYKVETQIKGALGVYAASHEVGRWSQSIFGVGPIISAGLLAHIDITKAPTVGHIWSFAGLNPDMVWEKGMKRPYNAKLKTLCWKMADVFMKNRNKPGDMYGHFYDSRKAYETAKNEAGEYAGRAAKELEKKNIKDKDLKALLESGKIPPGQIHNSSLRYVAKLFLAHWHHVAYECHYGTLPPKPYIIDRGHAHIIGPVNWPMETK